MRVRNDMASTLPVHLPITAVTLLAEILLVWCSSHTQYAFTIADVSACRDADLIGARVSWSPLVVLLERASVNLGLSRFDTSLAPKIDSCEYALDLLYNA